jgi:hypothetical protein
VVGKTAEEIEGARQKLTEAGARLEKTKEAHEAKKANEEKKKRAYEERVNFWVNEYNHRMPANAGIAAVNNQYQNIRGAPGLIQNTTNTASTRTVNDMILTPQGQFNTHPDDYILAMKNPAAPVNAGITAVNNQYQNIRGAPGLVQNNTSTTSARTVTDMILTPQGQFNTHPNDYILAMKNPAASVSSETLFPREIQNEIRSVERVPQAAPPVVVEGEIELRSELVIDDKGYRLRQAVEKNTTPYKFATGSAKNARLIQ